MLREINDLIIKREATLKGWLFVNGHHCVEDQKHLDAGTEAQKYWHYGYLVALRDIRKKLGFGKQAN